MMFPQFSSRKNTATEREALTKLCSALAREHNVKVQLVEGDEIPKVDLSTREIVLNVSELGTNEKEYYVGMLLHEIGHLRYTKIVNYPKSAKTKDQQRLFKMIVNILEDTRIEAKIKEEYMGGGFYLDELHEPHVIATKAILRESPVYIPRNLSQIPLESALQEAIEDIIKGLTENNTLFERYEAKEISTAEKRVKIIKEQKEKLRAKINEDMLLRIIGYAVLKNKTCLPFFSSTGIDEADELATQLSKELFSATQTTSTEEIFKLTDKFITKERLYDIFSPLPEDTTTSSGNKDTPLTSNTDSALKELAGNEERGELPSNDSFYEEYDSDMFVQADQRARPLIEPLKKRLLNKLKENQHQRFVSGKNKGLLDKRSLARVARGNYRVYRKKEEKKGTEYACSIVVDTSGSMFAGFYVGEKKGTSDSRIMNALISTAVLTRTLQSLGFQSSITFFGSEARTMLKGRERYIPSVIDERTKRLNEDVWDSGTNIADGVKEGLKELDKFALGRHKLLIVLTDGGVHTQDKENIQEETRKREKKGNFSAVIFYIGRSASGVLDDPDKEIEIEDVSELPVKASNILSKLKV